MNNIKKLSVISLLIGSIFFTGCDSSKITEIMTKVTEGIQKAMPAIKNVVEIFNGIGKPTVIASNTVVVTAPAPVMPIEKDANADAAIVIPASDDTEEIANTNQGKIQAPASIEKPPTITIDTTNAKNATVETTKVVIANLERALKAQEAYLKTHLDNQEVTKGILKLKTEIEKRKNILLELQASEKSNTEDPHETKFNPDLSQSVNTLLSSNNQNIRGLKTAIKEKQEKIAKYPDYKEEYLKTIILFKNRIRAIEEENKQVTSTNIAVMGVVTARTLKRYKAILELDASTHEKKIYATKQVIACFYYGISLYKDNLKNHPNNKDVMAKYDYFKSEMIKYKTILSKLQATD